VGPDFENETKKRLCRLIGDGHDCRIGAQMRTFEMCEKCLELDRNIEYYRDIASRIPDEAMLRGIEVLIERVKARKADLHPEQ
jgi:hypothetical protein